MKIIEYEENYQEEVKELLEELQEYMISVDKEGYSTITKDYKEKYFEKNNKRSKCLSR